MRELISLTKVHLDSTFGFSNMKYKIFKQKKDLWKPILFIIVIASLIPAYMLYLVFIENLYLGLKSVNQSSAIITLAFSAVSIMILIFSIVHVMSIYYFSTDTSILVPMPIKPKNIILSKFIGMVVTQYIYTLPFIIPIVVVFGTNEGKGLVFIIYAIICSFLIPIVPLSISTILVMLIMKITNIKGKKDLIRTISMFVMLAVILGIQLFVSSATRNIPTGEEQQYIAQLLENNMNLVKLVGKTFPLSIIVTKALVLEGIWSFINLVFNLLICSVFLCATIQVGEKVYLGGIIGGQERTTGVKQLSSDALKVKLQKKSKPSIAVFMLDIRLLLRTPAYVFNCVSIVILMPLILIIMPIVTEGGPIAEILKYYEEFYRVINLGLVAFFIFIAATNPTASTTFSREGKNFWITRLAPVKPMDQIKGRMLTSVILQLIGILFVIIGMSFLVKLKLETLFVSLFFGILGSLPIFALGLLIDLVRPVLNWENPQKAVKQNMNVLISMVVGIVYAAILGLLAVFLLKIVNSFFVIYCIFTLIFIIITTVLVVIINNIFAERFVNVE